MRTVSYCWKSLLSALSIVYSNEHVFSHKAAKKEKKNSTKNSNKTAIGPIQPSQTSGTPNRQLNTAA